MPKYYFPPTSLDAVCLLEYLRLMMYPCQQAQYN